MIEVTAYEHHAEVKILPNPGRRTRQERKGDFFRDLNRFKDDIHHKDRKYEPSKMVWLVTNLEAYTNVPYIFYALELRKCQPALF